MADVFNPKSCINLQAGGSCCLRESPCPHASDGKGLTAGWVQCTEARVALRVILAPDEFVVLADPDGKPSPGRFPLRRCRITSVEDAAGVHTSSLLSSRGDASLLDALPLGPNTIMLTTRDGNASLMWKSGSFLPA